jgi:hypothetical protein
VLGILGALKPTKLNLTAGDLGATGIAEALKSNTRLTYLDVHACGIHDSGATVTAHLN